MEIAPDGNYSLGPHSVYIEHAFLLLPCPPGHLRPYGDGAVPFLPCVLTLDPGGRK